MIFPYSKIAMMYGSRLSLVDTTNPKDIWVKKIGVDRFLDKAYYLQSKTIVLGTFKTEEIREMAFWHELGHHIVNNARGSWTLSRMYWRSRVPALFNFGFPLEVMAWKEGLKLAKKHGRVFSEETYIDANKAFGTYMSSGKVTIDRHFELAKIAGLYRQKCMTVANF